MHIFRKYNILPFELDIKNRLEDMRSVNPRARDSHDHTVLHWFALHDGFDAEIIQDLINKGADLEIQNITGKTAFLLAVVNRQRETIEKLIENGADVHVQDVMDNNALHYIVLPELEFGIVNLEEDSLSILRTLLNRRVDVNSINRQGETPLMWAARGCYLENVRLLLASGADVHLRNENLYTCLHFAATCNYDNEVLWDQKNFAVMSELIRNGASINSTNKYGRTPLDTILQSTHANRAFFASEYVRNATLVHWKERIHFVLFRGRNIRRLRSHKEIEKHAEACHVEVGRMVLFQLTERYNLCQFALGEVSEAEWDIEYQISNQVLDILSRETFKEYHDFIKARFRRLFLRRKMLELVFLAKLEMRHIVLVPDVLFEMSGFLEDKDIFNVIYASL